MTLQVAGWAVLWLVCFWAFVVIGFPSDTAKDWLAQRFAERLNATVAIGKLGVRWNLGLRLDDVAVGERPLVVHLPVVTIEPNWFSVLMLRPTVAFTGRTISGAGMSGAYAPDGMTLQFSDVRSNDVRSLPLGLPPNAVLRGVGTFKPAQQRASIEAEIEGGPAGRQRFQLVGKDAFGLIGTLKITISTARL